MFFAPRHDWTSFDTKCRAVRASRLRSLTTDEAWAMYVSMFDLVASQTEPTSPRLKAAHWNEKLVTRRKLVAAFSKLDELKRERGSANDSGGRDTVAP